MGRTRRPVPPVPRHGRQTAKVMRTESREPALLNGDDAPLAQQLKTLPTAQLFDEFSWRRLASELRLTPRQCEIARLICEGGSYKSIASQVQISINTVRMHVRALFAKLGVRDRVGLMLKLITADRLLNGSWRATGSAE